MLRRKLIKTLLMNLVLTLLLLNILGVLSPKFILSINDVSASPSVSDEWIYNGWQYRKVHNIIGDQLTGAFRFYDLSPPWTTISGNPTQRHAFQPVHNTTMIEVNKLVDGATRKYLAYDSDAGGSQIRLYYTNDTAGLWTPYSRNPILGPSVNYYRWPSTAYVNGTFHMFLADRTNLTLERWTSTDGINYTFSENVKTGGNEYKNPFIWNNPNDKRWYLYSHDASGATESFKVRNATGIEDLDVASDAIVVSRNMPFGSPTVMFYDGKYWLLGEIYTGGLWRIVAYCSTASPSIGFTELTNSPILSNDEACPMLLLSSDQTKAYLFVSRGNSAWYQDTREVYLNSTITPELPALANYQIKIKTFYGSGIDSGENVYLNGHSRSDFGDIRFTWFDSSSKSEVSSPYWIEELSLNNSAVFWVKVPEIPNKTNATIYIYYGKNDVTTTSNGEATFDFFDDFSGNLGKWTVVGGTWQIENGELSAQTTASPFGQRIRATNFSFGNNSVHVKVKWVSGTYFEGGPFVRGQQPNEQNNGYMTFLSTWGGGPRDRIAKMSSAEETTLAGQGTTNPSQNVWYDFVFSLYSSTLKSSNTPLYPTEISGVDNNFSNGTLNLFSWSAASEHVHYDALFVTKYVNPEPKHAGWGSEETAEYVIVDNAFVSDSRADVGSVQTVGFHAKWNNNGSDIVGGSIYVNNTNYIIDSTGWINFSVDSPTVGNKKWVVTGVNCGGVTAYTQIVPTPSIVWDQIKIIDGGKTKSSLTLGETTTIWFKAVYDYNNDAFDGAKGILYANGSAMPWSNNSNRWEHVYEANSVGTTSFDISKVLDNSYNITHIKDLAGTQSVTIVYEPFSVVSNSTISELAFNSTNKILTFTVNGSSGTTGFTNVTLSKALIGDISTLQVYIDENETSYLATSTEYYWLVHFNYSHSTHRVIVSLGSSQPTPPTSIASVTSSQTTSPNNVPSGSSKPSPPENAPRDSPQPSTPSTTPSNPSDSTAPSTVLSSIIIGAIVFAMAILLATPVLWHRNKAHLRKTKKTLSLIGYYSPRLRSVDFS